MLSMDRYREELKAQEIKEGRLVNIITDYAIANRMSMEELDKCVDKVKELYYTDATIRRNEVVEATER